MTPPLADGYSFLSLGGFIWATIRMFLLLLGFALVQMWRESEAEDDAESKQ